MSHPDDERSDAAKTKELVRKKLLEIMDLQADVDALLRHEHPTPLGSAKWKNAEPEEMQRVILLTAIQFVLFEPEDWVVGSDQFQTLADDMVAVLIEQIDSLRKKYH